MIRYIRLRNNDRYPVGYVAVEVDKTTYNAKIGVSTLHVGKDKYDSALGRTIAEARLNRRPIVISLSKLKRSTINIEVMQAIVSGNFPERAKRAAKIWIRDKLNNQTHID